MNKLAFRLLVAMSLAIMAGCANQEHARREVPPPPVPPAVPAARPQALVASLRQAARREIELAAVSNDPRLRANAIEAAQEALEKDSHDIVARGLSDRESIVRFAAAMAAGTLRFADLHDPIANMVNDPVIRVQIAAVFALHRLGDTQFSHDLEKAARDPNPRTRVDTAFVLGLLEEPSARKVLRPMMLDQEADVRIQVAESLWRMHEPDALEVLTAGLISKAPDDQMLCILALVGPKDSRVSGLLRGKLTDPYTEVALVSARAMGELGMDDGLGVALKGVKNADPRQRYLAAMALGAIGRTDSQDELAALLKDREASVRLAAATAILRLKPAS